MAVILNQQETNWIAEDMETLWKWVPTELSTLQNSKHLLTSPLGLACRNVAFIITDINN